MIDVIAVSTDTNKVLWVEPRKSERTDDAIINMAIMRQGMEDRFFTEAECGKYKTGDEYKP